MPESESEYVTVYRWPGHIIEYRWPRHTGWHELIPLPLSSCDEAERYAKGKSEAVRTNRYRAICLNGHPQLDGVACWSM